MRTEYNFNSQSTLSTEKKRKQQRRTKKQEREMNCINNNVYIYNTRV